MNRETAFIIGGGPTVLQTRFEPIKRGFFIGCNCAFLLGSWVDVCFFCDPRWFAHWRKTPVFVEYAKSHFLYTCYDSPDTRRECIVFKKSSKHYGITDAKNEICWNHNTGLSAINLAFQLGFKRIVLIGFDGGLVEGKKNFHDLHTFESFTEKHSNSGFAHFPIALKHIVNDAVNFGIEILNASPVKSNLTRYFERIQL